MTAKVTRCCPRPVASERALPLAGPHSEFSPGSPRRSRRAVRARAGKLRAKVGDQIEIINAIVPLVNYDDATQSRINALNVEMDNTRIAEQRAKTAEAAR